VGCQEKRHLARARPSSRAPGGGRDEAHHFERGGQQPYLLPRRSQNRLLVRPGVENIWICDSDGSNPVQLTSFDKLTGTPRWSPDGRRITFDSLEAGDWNEYVIDADGGIPRRLTPEASAESTASWSRDGRWVYFASDRTGTEQIWKIPPEGGEAVQVTRDGGHYGEESWDGRYLYYSKAEAGPIWRMPTRGGEATEVLPGPIDWLNWALSRGGLYFHSTAPGDAGEPEHLIRHLDFSRPAGSATCIGRKGRSGAPGWPSPETSSGSYTKRSFPGPPS
jgi:dipeptidyl aminopeptidase/acylaminoacyl peptidase